MKQSTKPWHKIIAITTVLLLSLMACGKTEGSSDDTASFPNKDITLIVQAAPGGGSDLSSRTLAKAMEENLDVNIVVQNRPGASGSTAFLWVKDQPADGYIIGFNPVEMSMLGHLGYDIDPKNYQFIGQIMNAPGVISVPTSSPYSSLNDFLEAAKTKDLTVGNSGAGSIWEAATNGLSAAAGVTLKPVPFDGGAPAVAAAIGGQIDAVVSGAGEALNGYKDKQLRILAVFDKTTHPDLPDVPTTAELGIKDAEFGGWGGIYVPKDVPQEVVSKLEGIVEKAANSDLFKETMAKAGVIPVYKNSADYTAFVNSEYERFGKFLHSAD